jgi:hypothetical protein
MSKVPDDTVSQEKPSFFENGVVVNIKRVDFAVVNVVTYLPAYTPILSQYPVKLADDGRLLFQVRFDGYLK